MTMALDLIIDAWLSERVSPSDLYQAAIAFRAATLNQTTCVLP
jgi:hypothetical protein